MVKSSWVDETWRLLAVDGLCEVIVEERVLDVQLVDRPRTRGSDAEDDLNRCRFDNRVKGLVVVGAVLLGEAADNLACLMTDDRSGTYV